jgi:hypothetical protein
MPEHSAIPVSDRFCWQPAPGLGPPRSAQLRVAPVKAAGVQQTVDRDSVRRDRSPNGVAWRFPDWTAVGFRLSGCASNALPKECVRALPSRTRS